MVKDLEDRINVLITENERLNRLVDDNVNINITIN